MGSAIVFTIALTVFGVLVVSLVSTLRSRAALAAFVAGVRELGVVPARLAGIVAAGAVCAELAIVVLLVVPGTTGFGLLAPTALFAVYAVALARAVRRGLDTSCHCFGAGDATVALRHVVRAAALSVGSLAGALVALLGGMDVIRPAGAPATLVAFVVAGACVAAAVWVDELVWLFGRPDPARRTSGSARPLSIPPR